jgi:hypothetical protein
MPTISTPAAESKTPDPARSAAGKKAAATRKRTAAKKATRVVTMDAKRTAGDARKSADTVTGDAKRTASAARTAARAAGQASEAEAKVRVAQVRQLAERSVDLPVGVSLVARDSLVSTVRGLTTTLGNRARMERELTRYERRGASVRNRFERQVEQTRSSFERGVRERRSRVTKLVGDAQSRIGSITP